MAKKPKSVYVCENCGQRETKWLGRCPQCGEWDTFEQELITKVELSASRSGKIAEIKSLSKVDLSNTKRVSAGSVEFDLVLGEGFVNGQVVLFSGEPGIGKSTLLLQTVVEVARKGMQPLYVSAEESEIQVAGRAQRLFPSGGYDNVDFTSENNLYSILASMRSQKYNFVVLDSIQTVYDPDIPSLPGSLSQIKACSSNLIETAKAEGIVLVLVGHINKDGNIAGPKVLEHLVDSVLQLEGERTGEYRILRGLKNRFGPTGEAGLFVMAEDGLQDMQAGANLLSGSKEAAVGTAKTISVEGNRSILLEVQALTNETVFAYPKRVAEGISVSRLQLICAILDRFAGAKLGTKDVYVRTAGGYKLKSAAADLAIAAAILSSLKKQQLPADGLYAGELYLSGKLFLSDTYAGKLKSLVRYGVQKLFVPKLKQAVLNKQLSEFDITQVSSLTQLLG